MTPIESREILVHRLDPSPGRRGGRKVLVGRFHGDANQIDMILAVEAGQFGLGRFAITWRVRERIVVSATAAFPGEPRKAPKPRPRHATASGNPSIAPLWPLRAQDGAQESAVQQSALAVSQTALTAASARVHELEQDNARLRHDGVQAHLDRQDDARRGPAQMNDLH